MAKNIISIIKYYRNKVNVSSVFLQLPGTEYISDIEYKIYDNYYKNLNTIIAKYG